MTATLTAERAWSCPDAELILPLTASRPEWLAARRNGIGGSDMGALMDLSPYTTPYQVWLDKMGRRGDLVPTKRMQRGTAMEPIIADEFAADSGLTFRRAGMQRSRTYPHLLASVDRLASDGGGVEIKRTDSYGISKQILAGNFPDYWLWQALNYLAVTGRTHWWLVAMLPMRDELWVERIDRCDFTAQIDAIGPMVEQWWATHVLLDTAPTEGAPYLQAEIVKGSDVAATNPRQVLADEARWIELKEIGGEADAEIELIKARVKAELGDNDTVSVEGRKVFKNNYRAGASKFLRKEFKAEHPDLEAKFSSKGEPTAFVSLV